MGGTSSVPVMKESPTLQYSSQLKYLPNYKGDKHWVMHTNETLPIPTCDEGQGSIKATPLLTLTQLFKKAGTRPDKLNKTAMKVERKPSGEPPADGKDKDVVWKTWTWGQYYNETCRAAKGFLSLGLQRFDAVMIYGFNAPEWHMSMMGAILAGGVGAGIYPTDTPDQIEFKARHSGSVVAVVQEKKHVELLRKMVQGGKLPKLRGIVSWLPYSDPIPNFPNQDGTEVQVLSWNQLVNTKSKEVTEETLHQTMEQQEPQSPCVYIYTSGTTGNPKAVMLNHDNLHFETMALQDILPVTPEAQTEERIISYLPLSHVAGMLVDIAAPMIFTAQYKATVAVTFARVTDLKEGTLKDRLQIARPTIFLGVPRVWEKIQEAMKAARAKNPPGCCKAGIINTARQKGIEFAREQEMGKSGHAPCCHGCCLYNKVRSQVKEILGLADCHTCLTGAAPIQVETLEFYGSLGIQINELYGMSECTGATTLSSNQAHVWGSCGWAAPGAEVAVLREEPEGSKNYVKCPPCPASRLLDPNLEEKYQGEICFRGRHIMMGYMANPDLGEEHVEEIRKKNMEAIDSQGWLHSGDKGTMDERGMFKITGRYKELIIGAGGENVAPVPIENAIKDALGGQGGALSNVMMIGDKRKYNVCVVTLTCEGATGEKPGTDVLAGGAKKVSSATKVGEAMDDQVWINKITAAITEVNKNGKVCPSNASRVQKFTILPIDFSTETGELTPTLKLKRKVVETKYSKVIEAMYDESCKEAYVKFIQ
eukprot:Sspe_Gene.1954::Locus_660_Transcript_1_1_Confidence_1.000_Length_2482::g.1954::m.1954/K15013/ACSBG; long-chain-fatty-acid--CoA ligase ACSBG